MRVNNWKIYNKSGSNLNLFADSYLNLEFETDAQNAIGAEAYAITDPSLMIVDVEIVNSGWNYDPNNTDLILSYSFSDYEEVLLPSEASINFIDVSIFNPEPQNSNGIGSIIIDLSTAFAYPSVTYTSAIFLNPVSQGLIETEHLSILEENSPGTFIRPYDVSNSTLVFKMDPTGDPEIKLFEIDEDNQTVEWADEIIFDTSLCASNVPIIINIGFKSEDEGVFERKLRAYHRIGTVDYQLMEIIVNAQSIGPDERFDTLIENFGLPSPKSNFKLFKEADINEDLPDWQLLNYKGKHIILEHDKIMPYIGTYKALINSIKWLGYEDIKIKEWFKNVKDNTKLSLEVPYEAADRSKTILYFSPDERRNLKKLNQLSLIYCITRETGEIDEYGVPLIEECYAYNISEILIKLKVLKEWLEKNIIGVNTRITDITGEGVYLERFKNLIYSTQNVGSNAYFSQSLTPKTLQTSSELALGEASIGLTLKEIEKTRIKNLNVRFKDLLNYYWDPSNGNYNPEDVSVSYYDPSTIFVGIPFKFPFYDLSDIQWRLSLENTNSGVLSEKYVTAPLFIYDNDIRFYNIFDVSSLFYDVSTNLIISLEKAYLRNPNNDNWEESLEYSIYADPYVADLWLLESSAGTIDSSTWGIFSLHPDASSLLRYAIDPNQKIPLLTFGNYTWTNTLGNKSSFPQSAYFLDIVDGKIAMDSSILSLSNNIIAVESYINFNYDTSQAEQKITLNVVYNSLREPLYLYDPSIYYNLNFDASDPSAALIVDNSIYIIKVNHIGLYNVEIFGWDGQNNIYRNYLRSPYEVWTKFPKIYSYIDTSCNAGIINVCVSTYLSQEDVSILIDENIYPIFDRIIPLYGLTLEFDASAKPYIQIPSISYFTDIPDPDSISLFYNATERIFRRDGDRFFLDKDYQNFNKGDVVNFIWFDKGKFSLLEEVSTWISNIGIITGEDYVDASGVPSYFSPDDSTEMYLLNDTERTTYNVINNLIDKTVNLDISSYRFLDNELVGMIISDTSTGYRWASSFRVVDSSEAVNEYGYEHTLEGNIPQFILDNSTRYILTAKHAFSTFASFQIDVSRIYEFNNNFHLYLNDNYYHQYYLDKTFAYLNILFDQNKIVDQWYDPSTDNLITGPFYPFSNAITLDISTLVILSAYYDPSTYMLNQKNIWTIWEKNTGRMLMRVFNENVPYIFNERGIYNVQCEAYDLYGNLKTQYFEGLITVI